MRGFLESSSAVTPTAVVAELFEKYRRLAEEFGTRFEFIRSRSRLAVLDEDLGKNRWPPQFWTEEESQRMGIVRLDRTRHGVALQSQGTYRRSSL